MTLTEEANTEITATHLLWFNQAVADLGQWNSFETLQHMGDEFLIETIERGIENYGLLPVSQFAFTTCLAPSLVFALVEAESGTTYYFYWSTKWWHPMLVGTEEIKKENHGSDKST